MRFLGNIEAKIDSKGRVFLPAAFRKVLQASGESGLVMRKDVFHPCLVLYPESVWNAQMDAVRSQLDLWDAEQNTIYRQFVSDVELVTLDSNGRFLIGKRYLKLANIEQDIRFIGMGQTIEIWSTANTEKPFMAPEMFGKKISQLMRKHAEANPTEA